jgi:CelD/BcsL family acetyltransferase involved in cellulose biosynthesis
MQIHTSGVPDFDELGTAWRRLEKEVPDCAFFQSWSWVGCLAAERYPNPVLLRAEQDGRTIGLALFNRRGGRLSLAESGEAALDAPFIEHNAPLAARPEVQAALLRAAWRVGGVRRLQLGGVAPALLHAAGGVAWRFQTRPAPWRDLDGIAGDVLAGCSANTRQQLRRSARDLAATGALRLERAGNAAEAQDWFAQLRTLHDATWQRRGGAGAFATDYLRRFHTTLIATTLPRGELALDRISAGDAVIGYLYNFRHGGRVSAYQSGFIAHPRGKPGMTCHALAMQRAVDDGDSVYDFLAGEARYKRSLADRETILAWAELVPRWSLHGLVARLRHRAS